jgi:hypothetical protein
MIGLLNIDWRETQPQRAEYPPGLCELKCRNK